MLTGRLRLQAIELRSVGPPACRPHTCDPTTASCHLPPMPLSPCCVYRSLCPECAAGASLVNGSAGAAGSGRRLLQAVADPSVPCDKVEDQGSMCNFFLSSVSDACTDDGFLTVSWSLSILHSGRLLQPRRT